MKTGSKSKLVVDSISNIGPHYARTLREWHRSFEERFDTVIEPALRAEYPEIMAGGNGKDEIEVFRRKWICGSSLPSSLNPEIYPNLFQITLNTVKSDLPHVTSETISSHLPATALKTTVVRYTSERVFSLSGTCTLPYVHIFL